MDTLNPVIRIGPVVVDVSTSMAATRRRMRSATASNPASPVSAFPASLFRWRPCPEQQDHELVAAEAADEVAVADLVADSVRDSSEDGVPGEVAEPVVDRLEAVEVDDQHRPRSGIGIAAVQCVVGLAVPGCGGEQPGLGVVSAGAFQMAGEHGAVQAARDGHDEQHEQRV
jgi:hypothetical protein